MAGLSFSVIAMGNQAATGVVADCSPAQHNYGWYAVRPHPGGLHVNGAISSSSPPPAASTDPSLLVNSHWNTLPDSSTNLTGLSVLPHPMRALDLYDSSDVMSVNIIDPLIHACEDLVGPAQSSFASNAFLPVLMPWLRRCVILCFLNHESADQ
jgi:hypothetical protein